MTTSTDPKVRAHLEAERERLRADLQELGLETSEELAYDDNFADSSQVTAERGEAEALAGELSDTLSEVEAALERLDAGTYGLCEVCGNQIGPDRLEAMPAAARCISCATKA
jgi:RNA polymerase-binding transcription factor DksA